MHTGQHLLSALLDVHAEGLPTLSWSMAPYPSLDLPYVELPRALTWAEAEEIERKCNEAIYESTKVWVDVTMQEEGFVKETAAGVRENRGIPSDYKDVSCAVTSRSRQLFGIRSSGAHTDIRASYGTSLSKASTRTPAAARNSRTSATWASCTSSHLRRPQHRPSPLKTSRGCTSSRAHVPCSTSNIAVANCRSPRRQSP